MAGQACCALLPSADAEGREAQGNLDDPLGGQKVLTVSIFLRFDDARGKAQNMSFFDPVTSEFLKAAKIIEIFKNQ